MSKRKRKQRKLTEKEKYKPYFIFERKNFVVMGIGLGIIVLGFLLMVGGGSDDPNVFNPDIYSWRRIRLAPILVLIGFGVEVYAILLNPSKG